MGVQETIPSQPRASGLSICDECGQSPLCQPAAAAALPLSQRFSTLATLGCLDFNRVWPLGWEFEIPGLAASKARKSQVAHTGSHDTTAFREAQSTQINHSALTTLQTKVAANFQTEIWCSKDKVEFLGRRLT